MNSINKIKINIKELTVISILLIAFLTICYLVYFGPKSVYGQTSFTASLIGGTTKGIQDLCCNGLELGFTSISKGNIYILDENAMWMWGITDSYQNGNEFTMGYYTLGKLFPIGACLDVSNDCVPSKYLPTIRPIGTGGIPSLGGGI